MAAYIRLASRTQAKFQNKRNLDSSGFRAQPHLRRARHPPICHFDSRLARVQLCTHWTSGLPRHFRRENGGCFTYSSVEPRSDRVSYPVLVNYVLYSCFHVKSHFPLSSSTRWRNHVTRWSLKFNSSSWDARIFGNGMTTTLSVNSVALMKG